MSTDVNPGKELSSIDFSGLIGGPLVAVVQAQAQAALSTVNFIHEVGFKKPVKEDPDADPGDMPTTGEPIYVVFKYPKEVSPYEPKTGHVIAVEMNASGDGYTTGPDVTIVSDSGCKGSGAKARAVVNDGKVTSIEVYDQGTGYTKAPTVKIAAPPAGGTPATARTSFTPAKAAVPAVFQEMKLEVPLLSIVPIPYIRVEEVTIDFNAKINSMHTDESAKSFARNTEFEKKGKAGFFLAKASAAFKCSTSRQSNSKSMGKVERTFNLAVHVRAVQDELPGGMEKILGILEDAIKSQPTAVPKAITLTE
jgi:hypothetical protein